jgi:hypothetical protein
MFRVRHLSIFPLLSCTKSPSLVRPSFHRTIYQSNLLVLPLSRHSPKPRATPPHHISLTDQFGIKFTPIQSQVDVEVDAVESSLRRIHPLKVLFEVLPREVARQSNDFLDAWIFGVFYCT